MCAAPGRRLRSIGQALAACLAFLFFGSAALAQQWVTPPVAAPGVQRPVFFSATLNAPVSYHVYTPAAYDLNPTRRFPVLYWLHGSNSVLDGIAPLSAWFDQAIADGQLRPMIVVFPNGLPLGMWCDWANGAAPIESIIVRDLVPHVDATFRTIATREGRIIEGFSMGGYGAARIGLRHAQIFGGVSMLGAGPLQLDFLAPVPGSPVSPAQRAVIFQNVYANDPAVFLAQSPWTLAAAHRDAVLALDVPIRQLIGGLDFTLPANLDFHDRLGQLGIPHAFFNPPQVGHDALGLFTAIGASNWPFYHAVFGRTGDPAPTVCCRGATCQILSIDRCTSPPVAGFGALVVVDTAVCNPGGVSDLPCCLADVTKSGGVGIDDLFVYLNAWFASSVFARTGSPGLPTLDDVFVYLGMWFSGCP